jgi:hypothetical protein
LAEDAEAECGEAAEEHNSEDYGSIAKNDDAACKPGEEDDEAAGEGGEGAESAGGEEELDGEIREIEDGVKGIAEFFGEGPGAFAFEAGEALVGDELAAEAEPEQKGDEVGVGFVEIEEAIADGEGAGEDIDAAGGHVRDDEAAVEGPEEIGGKDGGPGIVAGGADAEDDVGAVLGEDAVKLHDEIGGFLEVSGHDGEAGAAGMLETGKDGGEGAEVAAEGDKLRGEGSEGEALGEDFGGAVGAGIDDEDDFEGGDLGMEGGEGIEEAGEVGLVAVDGDDDGEHQDRD